MRVAPISFAENFALLPETWRPKEIAAMNDHVFEIIRVEGEFEWHSHGESEKAFIVLEGVLRIAFRDGALDVKAGEMIVLPKGAEHKPSSEGGAKLLLIEPRPAGH